MFDTVQKIRLNPRKTSVMGSKQRQRGQHMKTAYTAILLSLSAGCMAYAGAATPEAKSVYQQSMDSAAATYKVSRARCDSITGNPKDVCIAEARAARVHTEADAESLYKNTLDAYTKAREQIAGANYEVDRTRCDAQTGNDKDVCVKQAEATRVAALADAKADKKVIEARSDAREDKRIAEYKVASERCDALAGSAKDNCVAAAKAQFGY
jgi:hypothetical protein